MALEQERAGVCGASGLCVLLLWHPQHGRDAQAAALTCGSGSRYLMCSPGIAALCK